MESVKNIVGKLKIQTDVAEELKRNIKKQFSEGLKHVKDKYNYSPLKMLPTYMSVFKNETHRGRFVSIDFGGTNIRIVKIKILDDNQLITESRSEKIPEYIKTSTATKLFGYIAKFLKKGLVYFKMNHEDILCVGFTFSFPCYQTALDRGKLIHWTKGFNITDVEGRDVVKLLERSCLKYKIKVQKFCLINDTTGVLLCGSFEDRNTFIGFINGTGINACYLEKIVNVEKLVEYIADDTIIVNTEKGSLGDCGCLSIIRTCYDKLLDKNSLNPGRQIFEKMVSGLYLPELVRIILEKEAAKFEIFKRFPKRLRVPYSMDGKYLSIVDNKIFKKTFKKDFKYKLSNRELKIIKELMKAVVFRASVLAALALSQLVEKVDAPKVVIAADGSMCTKHPTFLLNVAQAMNHLTGKNFEFKLVDDGSGKGSALAACIASNTPGFLK